jgi:SRSO17 transposase
MDASQLQSRRPSLAAWVGLFEPCFRKAVTFDHFQIYLTGLMADLKRKSIEPIALGSA